MGRTVSSPSDFGVAPRPACVRKRPQAPRPPGRGGPESGLPRLVCSPSRGEEKASPRGIFLALPAPLPCLVCSLPGVRRRLRDVALLSLGPPRPGGRGASEVLGGGGAGRELVILGSVLSGALRGVLSWRRRAHKDGFLSWPSPPRGAGCLRGSGRRWGGARARHPGQCSVGCTPRRSVVATTRS